MRVAARVDANQAQIVAALRKAGAFVQITSAVGQGFVDLVVAYNGKWMMFECKDGAKPPSKQTLKPMQIKWHETASQYAPVHVVNSVEQALAALDIQGAV